MDIKEKLRLAALCAETKAIKLIPPDSEIDWTPSEAFNKKMSELIARSPKRRLLAARRFIIAAAVITAVSMVFVPVWMRNTSGTNPSISEIESSTDNVSENESESDYRGNDESDGNGGVPEVLPPSVPAIPYCPSYLPNGYALSNVTVSERFTEVVYSNGNDSIRLYYYTGETDFSALDGTKNDFERRTYYSRVPKFINSDSIGNDFPEYIFFPEEVEWNKNNIAWNSDGMTFAVMGNANISADEMAKIASSVDIDPKE